MLKNKVCTKCKVNYPATVEYFYRHSTHKDGLRSQCKKCRKPYYKRQHSEYYQKHKETYNLHKRLYKEKHWLRVRASQWNTLYSSSLTEHQLKELFENQDTLCTLCGIVLNSHCHLDHIVPRCLGGQSKINNLQFLCEKCNKGKNKWPVEDYINHCERVFNFNKQRTE